MAATRAVQGGGSQTPARTGGQHGHGQHGHGQHGHGQHGHGQHGHGQHGHGQHGGGSQNPTRTGGQQTRHVVDINHLVDGIFGHVTKAAGNFRF
ncbi:hypothetical protein PSU4_25120 [Pseudonocardia sulfidoxydans NBRC 16205]|uniref:Uncharacterized protein n=1 Tax=Pseudonocardia sulfidoxydans NBRC 16205 TaxID=1223511 RepID=A0A511DKI0_9PSEU|nr:hypothetical protein PSU4_25120 [Pseudonocardia sulfidoxydans NBRC 16205]